MDGLEPAASMAEICRKKGIYNKLIETPIVGVDKPLDVPDGEEEEICKKTERKKERKIKGARFVKGRKKKGR